MGEKSRRKYSPIPCRIVMKSSKVFAFASILFRYTFVAVSAICLQVHHHTEKFFLTVERSNLYRKKSFDRHIDWLLVIFNSIKMHSRGLTRKLFGFGAKATTQLKYSDFVANFTLYRGNSRILRFVGFTTFGTESVEELNESSASNIKSDELRDRPRIEIKIESKQYENKKKNENNTNRQQRPT